MLLLGSMGGVLWGFQVTVGLINSSQKSEVLVSPMGVLSKGHIRGQTVDHKNSWGSCIRNLYLLMTLPAAM